MSAEDVEIGRWTGKAGSIRFVRSGPQVTVTQFAGLMGPGAAQAVRDSVGSMLDSSHGPVHHFIDLGALVRPESEVRNAYMALLLEHRRSLASLSCHFDADSVLTSLMVTAANIALGGMVRMYKDPTSFERAKRLAAGTQTLPFARAS